MKSSFTVWRGSETGRPRVLVLDNSSSQTGATLDLFRSGVKSAP
ncbi:MAG: hypothetical protein MjAS7_0096 [Metallosphaera javensis (ex Sakai et al. 2022)]|nr:MAG: hypothetical protein MjAS7_0096 [Metallosphaera javensis (ex Sakai et al. 2022)]